MSKLQKYLLSSVIVAVVAAAMLAWGKSREIALHTQCGPFVSEIAPDQTPRLLEEGGKKYVLISFTPAPSEEVSSIYWAGLFGPIRVVYAPTKQHFTGVKTGSSGILFPASNEAELSRVLSTFCFENSALTKRSSALECAPLRSAGRCYATPLS